MRILQTIAATLLAALCWCGIAEAACQGQIVSGTTITGKTAYDPFEFTGVTDQFSIGIRNNGAQSCVFAVAFTATSTPAKLGGALSYTLTDLNGATVLSAIAGGQPPSLQSPPVNVNAKQDIPFNAVILPGQFSAPGAYSDTLSVMAQLYAVENGAYTLLERVPLSISYAVKAVMTVNIAGGGLATTLDFGSLAQDAQQAVRIQARSNLCYALKVTSDNGGVLVLTPSVAGRTWQIPYRALLDGHPLDFSKGAELPYASPSSIGPANHTLAVTIGNISQKRAGLYKDIITIEILAAKL
jgi:hypothetical protein